MTRESPIKLQKPCKNLAGPFLSPCRGRQFKEGSIAGRILSKNEQISKWPISISDMNSPRGTSASEARRLKIMAVSASKNRVIFTSSIIGGGLDGNYPRPYPNIKLFFQILLHFSKIKLHDTSRNRS